MNILNPFAFTLWMYTLLHQSHLNHLKKDSIIQYNISMYVSTHAIT